MVTRLARISTRSWEARSEPANDPAQSGRVPVRPGVLAVETGVETAGQTSTTRQVARSVQLAMAARMGFEPMEALRLQRFSRSQTAVRTHPSPSGAVR